MTTGLSDFQVALVARRARAAELVTEARAMGARGDTDGLRGLARTLAETLADLPSVLAIQIRAEVDPIFEAAFPTPALQPGPIAVEWIVKVLDAPWVTAHRRGMVSPVGRSRLQDMANAVTYGPTSPARTRAARLILRSDLGHLTEPSRLGLLAVLHAAGELTERDVTDVLETHHHFGTAITGSGPAVAAIRAHADDRLWEVTAPDRTEWPDWVPRHVPAGPRFVLRGIDMLAGRHPVDRGLHAAGLPERLCQAILTGPEADELAAALAARPAAERTIALAQRYAAGDAERFLGPFGLARAAPVLDLVRRSEAAGDDSRLPPRCDVAAVREVIDAANPDQARFLLAALAGNVAAEQFAAVYGWNATEVGKRFARHAYAGIAAFGLLPAEGDEVLDRYLALRASARHGATFGAQRRVTHAEAVDLAFDHLAQVAGYPDASELELGMEARIAATAPTDWDAGDYRITLDPATAELVVTRAGKTLAGVPAPVRKTDAYKSARAAQDGLREQRRRLRLGLVERLVSTGSPVDLDTLCRYLAVPAAAGLLRAVIWRDVSGTTGLLTGPGDAPADVGAAAAPPGIRALDGTIHPLTGPVQAVHPVELDPADLTAWQREIVRTRTVQPVKQAFREVYTPTPAEIEAGIESPRFAGHTLDGRIAARLLSGRGWHIEHRHLRPLARTHGDIRAEAHAEYDHYFADPYGGVVLGTVAFFDGRATTRLDAVPPRPFSETMRDLDLAVGVAGRGLVTPDTGLAERAALLAALVADLGLANVTVAGHTAHVVGTRARYRVHLGSGSIHVEPAGYLCVVPAGFGAKPARGLFLPFADEDRMTSVVLSKVLLLARDEKITDVSILSQLERLTGRDG